MQKAYKFSVVYFLLFSLILLASSILLFSENIGLSIESILNYYRGNEEKFMLAKTTAGLLKVILPHFLGFGLFLMVVLHFVVFTKTKHLPFIIYLVFTVALMELLSPFFIIYGFEFFAYVKLVSFIALELLLLYLFWVLLRSIFFE